MPGCRAGASTARRLPGDCVERAPCDVLRQPLERHGVEDDRRMGTGD